MKLISVISSLLFSTVLFSQDIKISDVQNNIQYGPLIGNRSITFGVKNILEEVVQDKGYDINPNSKDSLFVEIIYFGNKRTQTTAAIYTKKENIVEIIAIAKYKNKSVKVKGVGKDIKSSFVILNNEGGFKQSSVSTALKKMCEKIIKKLKL